MNQEIVFERAKITSVEHKIRSGSVSSRVKVVAIATAKIARAIGARWLLDKEALVKQGFTSVELDYVLKNVRAKHSLDKVANLEMISELITKFKVFRKGDDDKKSKRLMVSFMIHHGGSPFELLEHLMKVGGGEGVCTLVPLQVEMFDKPSKPAKERKGKAKQGTLASAAEVDRKASAKRERAKKGKPDPMEAEKAVVPVGTVQ